MTGVSSRAAGDRTNGMWDNGGVRLALTPAPDAKKREPWGRTSYDGLLGVLDGAGREGNLESGRPSASRATAGAVPRSLTSLEVWNL